jgi:hypothetical protein
MEDETRAAFDPTRMSSSSDPKGLKPVHPRTLRQTTWSIVEHGRKSHKAEESMKYLAEFRQHPIRARLRAVVLSHMFEYFVGILLLSNAFVTGCGAQIRAHYPQKDLPVFFMIADFFFMLAFTIELVLRVYVLGVDFFWMNGWAWNVFDLVVVSVQVVEFIVQYAQQAMDDKKRHWRLEHFENSPTWEDCKVAENGKDYP